MTSPSSIIKPPRLRPGNHIGIVAPAGPVNKSDLESGLRILESAGLVVHVASHVYDRQDYLAGEDEARLADLHLMFERKEIKAIFCARGGYGSQRLLDKVHYNTIKENPKIIVGYSDITALLMAIYKKTGLVTFHGPFVQELAYENQGNWDDLFRIISSDKPLKLDLECGTALIPGKASGPLVGGNLSLICHLLGTPFLPSFDGCTLFIEEKGEPLYRLDRMLTHLALTGQLKRLSGFIAGTFEGCGNISAINRILMDMLFKLGIPLVTGVPVGHGSKNMALPIGLVTDLDTDLMTLSIGEACVR